MSTVKVGVIGAGQISYSHAAEINAHPQGEVVAVADPNEMRAKKLAKACGAEQIFGEAKDLIADADVDAVSIAVPNKFHAPYAKAALQAGKHVLLDKPFALDRKEAKQVIDAAKRKKKTFMLGMNWRYRAETQTLKALIERGDLGEVYHAKTTILRRQGIPKMGTWFCRKDLAGGGALLDIGVHFLDLCLYLIGNFEPVSVAGAAYTKFGHRGLGEGSWGMSDPDKKAVFDVDDFATGFIRFRDGCTVQLDASWMLHLPEPKMSVDIFGSEAGAQLLPAPGKICRFAKKKGEYEVVEPQGVKRPCPSPNRFANWLDVILGEAEPACTMEQALAVQKILDALYESSEKGKEVRIR
jgi:predicted dehydrogenase